MDIGSKGLCEVNLTIPQGCSLTFSVVHKDEEGNVVDHSASTARMAFQKSDKTNIDLSPCCSCGQDGVAITVPASQTAAMEIGKMSWDLIVETASGETMRMAYGKVSIVDTYALDE